MSRLLTDIDHVGIAVGDLDAAVAHYQRTLGLDPAHREVVLEQGVEEVLFQVGSSHVQLLGSLGPDTPVGKFLAKRGPGVHHIAYRVEDIDEALRQLKAQGVPLIDDEPRDGSRGTRIAFVHPKGFDGVLVELVQESPAI